jgi:hypothetical protein
VLSIIAAKAQSKYQGGIQWRTTAQSQSTLASETFALQSHGITHRRAKETSENMMIEIHG